MPYRGGRNSNRGRMTDFNSNIPIPEYDGPIIDWAAKRAEFDVVKNEKFKDMPSVVKNFYTEHPDVTAMTEEQVNECRLTNRNISVRTKENEVCLDAPKPVRTFAEAWHTHPDLLSILEKKFEKPSPIQMQLWPVLLSGRDAVGIAQTGTGKTLAFLLPGIVNITKQPGADKCTLIGPKLLVLAPTRELAIQIHEEVVKLDYANIRSVCVYGQSDRRKQIQAIEDGAQVLVATPGRLDDMTRSKEIDLSLVTYVVFDEADRMLDMGFMSNLTYIISCVRDDRQFIMTSATWCSDVHYIASNYLKNEVLVRVGEKELEAVYTVEQTVKICERDQKFDILMEFLNSECGPEDKGIVFVNRKATCEPLLGDICSHFNYKFSEEMLVPDTLHGGMAQEAREDNLHRFRSGEVRLLICTDVAARGLDVPNVTFVINYDLPGNLEEYVHRAGRTGRAGNTGKVLSLVCWDDRRNVSKFITMLERAKAVVPEELQKMAVRAERDFERRRNDQENGRGGGGRGRGGGGRGRGGGGFRGRF